MTEEFIEEVVVDVCTRRVVCVSSLGDRKVVECDTYAEFMNVLNFIKSTLDTDEIKFTELAMTD